MNTYVIALSQQGKYKGQCVVQAQDARCACNQAEQAQPPNVLYHYEARLIPPPSPLALLRQEQEEQEELFFLGTPTEQRQARHRLVTINHLLLMLA